MKMLKLMKNLFPNDHKVEQAVTVSIAQEPVKKKYKRVGYCQRCGRCCHGQPLWDSLADAKDPESIEFKEVMESIKRVFDVDISKADCDHIDMRNGIAFCKQYPDRPDFCKLYPNVPEDLIDGCGFKFIDDV